MRRVGGLETLLSASSQDRESWLAEAAEVRDLPHPLHSPPPHHVCLDSSTSLSLKFIESRNSTSRRSTWKMRTMTRRNKRSRSLGRSARTDPLALAQPPEAPGTAMAKSCTARPLRSGSTASWCASLLGESRKSHKQEPQSPGAVGLELGECGNYLRKIRQTSYVDISI